MNWYRCTIFTTIRQKTYRCIFILRKDEDGVWWSSSDDARGCGSEGETLLECIRNTQEAFDGWKEAMIDTFGEAYEP